MDPELEVEFDEIRKAWDELGDKLAGKRMMSNEQILELIGRLEREKAARSRRRWAVAAALLVGVCAAVFYFRQPSLSGNEVARCAPQEMLVPAVNCVNPSDFDKAELREDCGRNSSESVSKSMPDRMVSVSHKPQTTGRRKVSPSVEVAATEVMCNSSCDSSAVLGQIRSFLLDKEV